MQNQLDARPFCEHEVTDAGANALEFVWADPRDIKQIVIDAPEVRNENSIISGIQYWRSTWPKNHPIPSEKRGSCQSGWTRQDDWYQGAWQPADFEVKSDPNLQSSIIEFSELTQKEFPEGDYSVKFRRTLKLRIEFDKNLLPVSQVAGTRIYTQSTLAPVEFILSRDPAQSNALNNTFQVEIFNGFMVNDADSSAPLVATKATECHLEEPVAILASESSGTDSFDGTLVTVSLSPGAGAESFPIYPFTFAIEDLLVRGFIFVPDLGVLIRRLGVEVTFASLAEQQGQEKSVYDHIFELPEQTLEQALQEFAGKARFYAVLGCEGVRSKWALTPCGDLLTSRQYYTKAPGNDTPRVFWEQNFARWFMEWRIDGEVLSPTILREPWRRERLEGYLPALTTTWLDDASEISITQSAYATPLEGTRIGDLPPADSNVVAMLKFQFENSSPEERQVTWSLSLGQVPSLDMIEDIPSPLFNAVDLIPDEMAPDSLVDAPYMETWAKFSSIPPFPARQPYQCCIKAGGDLEIDLQGVEELGPDAAAMLTFTFDIEPGDSREFMVCLPLLAVLEGDIPSLTRLRDLDFDEELNEVRTYWEAALQQSATIEVPSLELSRFYKAHLVHVLITNDRDLQGENVIGRVGSFKYGCYANEVAMITMDLDRRGKFAEVRKILDTFIKYQGTAGLYGEYEDIDGIFFGAGGYESGPGYNQNQGFVLWAIAHHVRLSGDWDWLRSIADAVVKGCNWINFERENFAQIIEQGEQSDSRRTTYSLPPLYKGLLPPGGVEDLVDYWFWLSTNAYNSFGLAQAADMLAHIDHPAAFGLAVSARDYMDAVRMCFLRLMERSPVILLHDGTFIPHVPCHATRRGRGFGWIQEVLEGAIHLFRCGILSPFSREATWVIKDLEDNLYLSEEYGYPLVGPDFDQYWFNRGGFSMQPFLLCNHMLYAIRNEPKHFLRAFCNAFAVDWRPDTNMFTEHPLPTMWDWRGDHYKTSDESNCSDCLRAMLACETTALIECALTHSDECPTQFSMNRLESFPPAAGGALDCPDSLRIASLTPRSWLADGQVVKAERVATFFGSLSIEIVSQIAQGIVRVSIVLDREQLPTVSPLSHLFFTVRVPDSAAIIQEVTMSLSSGDASIETDGQWVHVTLPESLAGAAIIRFNGQIHF